MNITPIKTGFVADISDIDLTAVSDPEFDRLYAAWLTYGVLRVRDQAITEDELQSFSAKFGPLEEIPMGRMPESERAKIKNRYVTQLSNIFHDGKPIGGLGNAEASWHSDMTYVETPPPASILLAIEIPAIGGDTYFSDQQAALDAIPDVLKTRLQTLTIKHNAAHTSIGKLRPGYEPFDDPREAPGAIHPIIRKHPETGAQCLYLGRREWAYIPGLSLQDSETLLDDIWSYAARADYVWRQQWRPSDIIIWDNRRVLHRRDNFDGNARRLMKRCQVLSRPTAVNITSSLR